MSFQHDAGAYITSRAGITPATTTDGSEQECLWVGHVGFRSAKLVVLCAATLGDAETLTATINWQDATDGSGTAAADYGTPYTATVVQTGTGSAEPVITIELDVDLVTARGFIMAQVTLTPSSTGTLAWGAIYLLSGGEANPVS